VGFSAGADTEVVRGDPEGGQFARFYLKDGVIVAVDAVNSPREFMACKQLVADRKEVDPERLADPDTDLKTLL
jgi:3-phenylpropionate/trans-cinnamate dioxygenase ferredoxin reductase subunit